jgi:hypothetical protein
MCLSTMDKKVRKLKSNIGWKIYTSVTDSDGKASRLPIYRSEHGSFAPVGEWNIDTNGSVVKVDSGSSYLSGYHLYASEAAARKWDRASGNFDQVAKVQFAGVVATGTQSHRRVIVARKFKFLE